MFDDLIRKYKKEKGINSLEQAKRKVRKRKQAMAITPGPAVGWADSNEDRTANVEMPDEKYANAVDPEKQENRQTENRRQLLTDAKRK